MLLIHLVPVHFSEAINCICCIAMASGLMLGSPPVVPTWRPGERFFNSTSAGPLLSNVTLTVPMFDPEFAGMFQQFSLEVRHENDTNWTTAIAPNAPTFDWIQTLPNGQYRYRARGVNITMNGTTYSAYTPIIFMPVYSDIGKPAYMLS